jgi:predicted TIM-barrel fold metal-dependent hydrolase
MTVIDADQHLFEPRTMWAEYGDPDDRERMLAIVDDEAGNAWLQWQGQRIGLAHVTTPGRPDDVGDQQQRARAGEPPRRRYDEALPDDFWEPTARLARLDQLGVDAAVCFPNYGLFWERELAGDLPATLANMRAWNRWAVQAAHDGRGRLHPVGHVTLRDVGWLERELRDLGAGGVRAAMVAPGLVDGRALSDPVFDRAWRAFLEHGITPVFHVANQTRLFGDAWYDSDPDQSLPVFNSVFLWVPAAVAIADLVLNGVLERHPDLRIGVMELSAVWLPMFVMFLDGGHDFTRRLNGTALTDLALRPSDYVRRQVRVAAFSYERPGRLVRDVGDVFMACSDWPHSEGTADPLGDYRAARCDPVTDRGLFGDNVEFLLRP